MPIIETSGLALYYEVMNPDGRDTVVMIHGLFGNHTLFYYTGAQTLADRGWRVILFDLPGHGLSAMNQDGFRVATITGHVLGLLDALEVKRAALVGYSYGVAVAVEIALTEPERVDRLLLIEPYGFTDEIAARAEIDDEVVRSLGAYTHATGVKPSPRSTEQYRQLVQALWDAGLNTALAADHDYFDRPDIHELGIPVAVLCGRGSRYVEVGRMIADRLGGSLVLTGGDHNLPMSRPAWVSQQVCEFLPAPTARPRVLTDHTDGAGAIDVEDLRVTYGHLQAVKGVSFRIAAGEFFAFLGANGAGKSSTINCLTTLLKPTSGTATVAGYRLGEQDQAIRDRIGVVFQLSVLDPRFTVAENLSLRARLHHMEPKLAQQRTDELAKLLDIGPFLRQPYAKLSGGQRRRADIARALIHRPQVLFLDEPTAGLDPHSREQVWQAIADVRHYEGMTVFLTTHYMTETERADMVYMIDQGSIIASGTPAALREKYSSSELSLRFSDEPLALRRLARLFPDIDLSRPRQPEEPVRLRVDSTAAAKNLLTMVWDQLDDFEFRHGSMDDVFLNLTGGTLQDRDVKASRKGDHA